MKSGDTSLLSTHETCRRNHDCASSWCVLKNSPGLRVGLEIRMVVALKLDMLPLAASYTGSGIADASSQTSRTLSLCTPASASGRSALLVLADMKELSGA